MSEQVGAVPTETRGRDGAAPRLQAGERGRLEELDALRGLAALGVVIYHYTTFYQWQHGHLQPLGFGFPAGNYGVHLFFLIGFRNRVLVLIQWAFSFITLQRGARLIPDGSAPTAALPAPVPRTAPPAG